MSTFGKKLRKARGEQTQQVVADRLGCAVTRISEWERGVRTPKPLTQTQILRVVDRNGQRVSKADLDKVVKRIHEAKSLAGAKRAMRTFLGKHDVAVEG